ncbi:uncharacterized protein LOC134485083 [Rattus norvegicus]|uniref:uncharacterized protein LOC134485083 n=1 Tax=Rattus norvegicus TaxID=10116 RepID=UPI002FD822C4
MAVQAVRKVLNEDDFLKADDVIVLKEHFVGVRVPSTSVWAHRAPGLASCLRGDLDYWLPWSTQGPGLLGCPSFLVYPVPHGVCSFYGLNLISDSLELDLNPNHREALGTEDNKSNRQPLLHCFSLFSTRQGSSHTGGIQPNSQQGECEMSVDEPTLQYDSVGRHLVASGAAAAVRTHELQWRLKRQRTTAEVPSMSSAWTTSVCSIIQTAQDSLTQRNLRLHTGGPAGSSRG